MSRWKMIYLARRNPALPPEAFPQAWREHSALGRQCRNVQTRVTSVRQCSRVLAGTSAGGLDVSYDGVNLLVINDKQSATDIWNDAETLAIMRPDEPRVFDRYVRECTLLCEEVGDGVGDGAGEAPTLGTLDGVCLVFFLKGRDGLGDYPWNERPSGASVINRVTGERPPGYDYDVIVECWFDDLAAFNAAAGDREVWAKLPPAVQGWCDPSRSLAVLTQVTHRRP